MENKTISASNLKLKLKLTEAELGKKGRTQWVPLSVSRWCHLSFPVLKSSPDPGKDDYWSDSFDLEKNCEKEKEIEELSNDENSDRCATILSGKEMFQSKMGSLILISDGSELLTPFPTAHQRKKNDNKLSWECHTRGYKLK